MNPILQTLLEAARFAPSADNMQPWKFAVAENPLRIRIAWDGSRKATEGLVDEQRMDRIALGGVLENILQTAEANAWEIVLDNPTPPFVAAVRIPTTPKQGGSVPPAIFQRVTNRRLYDGRELSAGILERLAARTPPLGGVTTHWITDRQRFPSLGSLLADADTARFSEPVLRASLLSKIRFDRGNDLDVNRGLSLKSLELSTPDRLGLRLIPYLPQVVLQLTGAMRSFGQNARRQVESSSGLAILSAPDDLPTTDLPIGRAMQRAWLALTAEGLAVQPMMSLVGLGYLGKHDDLSRFRSINREKVGDFLQKLGSLLPELGSRSLGFVFRFGYAPDPTARATRLPTADLLAQDLHIP